MSQILSFLTNGTPWAIEQSALETIISIAQRENNLEAILKERGEPLDNTRSVTLYEGTAIIPITGPLFPRANLFAEISGAYSVEMLAKDLAQAEANTEVRAVVLQIDSPGGHTTMINEFANQVAAFSKPIVSYVVGQAASAAYWIAAASDKIILDNTAMVGSIGVVAGFETANNKRIEIVSSHAPDKRPDLSSDEGRAVIQSVVDDMESVFIDAVMDFRTMSREQITALRGGVVIGAKAVEQGFADQVGSLESVILQLQMENPMDLPTLKADHPQVYQAAFDLGAASVDAKAAETTGQTTERERISAIMNHPEAKGREAQAMAFALETDVSSESAAKILAVSPKVAPIADKPGGQLNAHLESLNPDVGADDDNENEETGEKAALALILGGKS